MKYEYKLEFQNSIYQILRILDKKIIYLIIYVLSKNILFDIIISIK